jgi:endonuclease YncB( thermonuclease family)
LLFFARLLFGFVKMRPLVAEQSLRFDGFDTPELRGGCARSKKLARQAQAVTENYMCGNVRLKFVEAPEKFGRLVVRAPVLQARLIKQGLAKPATDKKRQAWCD